MKTKVFALLICLALANPVAQAQGQDSTSPLAGTIESIEFSGIADASLSVTLRNELQELRGTAYNPELAAQFADKIQLELPEFVAGTRTRAGTEPGKVVLVFVAAPISEDGALGENINARYPVETVALEGVPRSLISDSLWNELQKMVGQPLNNTEADRLRESLQSELGPRYAVERKVRRGTQPRQLAVVYEAIKQPMLRWETPPSIFAYHQKQGPSLFVNDEVDLAKDFGLQLLYGLGSNGDELTERYKGFRLALEKTRIGTERLGFRLELTSYGTMWKSDTLRASESAPEIPGIYRSRRAIAPVVAFAMTPDIYVTAGFEATELEMQFPEVHWESVRLGTAGVRFQHTFRNGGTRNEIAGGYAVRTAARSLESDFTYTRHSWDWLYFHKRDKNIVKLKFQAGRLTGSAPLFERFSAGNSDSLRGWNKFEIAPLGGSRTAAGTFEIGRSDIRVFYDAGSVWDEARPIAIRHSIGLTFGAGEDDAAGFFTIAAAIRNSRLEPSVMFRFGWR